MGLGATLLCLLLPAQARAQEPGDTVGLTHEECCKESLLPLGGRIVALGRAVVADTAPDAVLYNPAGLVGLHRAALVVNYRKLIADAQLLGLSYVTRPYTFGTFALSYTLVDQGTIPTTDSTSLETGATFRQVHMVAATFATAIGAGVSTGLTYRVFVANSPCPSCATGGSSTGATQLVDFGVQYHPRFVRGLAFGAALVNAGLPLQIVNYEQSDQPPVRERVGASYQLPHLFRDTTMTGTISAQVDAGGADGIVPAVGAQVTVGDAISIRGGWRSAGASTIGSLDSGVTLGVGLKLNRFTVSVGRALTPATGDTESPFQVTFGMSF